MSAAQFGDPVEYYPAGSDLDEDEPLLGFIRRIHSKEEGGQIVPTGNVDVLVFDDDGLARLEEEVLLLENHLIDDVPEDHFAIRAFSAVRNDLQTLIHQVQG